MADAHIPTLKDFISYARGNGFSRTDRFVANITLPPQISSGDDERMMSLLCEEAAFPGASIASRGMRINGLTEFRPGAVSYGNEGITMQFLVPSTWRMRYSIERWMDLCSDLMTRTRLNEINGAQQVDRSKAREVGWYADYASTINLFALVPGLLRPVAEPSGEENQTIRDRAVGALRRLGRRQADRGLSEIRSRIDPRAVSILRDAERILGTYEGDQNNFNEAPPEVSVFNITLHEAWPREIAAQPISHYSPGFQRINVTFTYKYWTSEYFSPMIAARPKQSNPRDFIRDTAIPVAASVLANRAGLLRARNIPLPRLPF